MKQIKAKYSLYSGILGAIVTPIFIYAEMADFFLFIMIFLTGFNLGAFIGANEQAKQHQQKIDLINKR